MKIRKVFSVKRVIWLIVILAVASGITYFVKRPRKDDNSMQTVVVSRQNIRQTVLATGQVVSSLDLDLSFQASGVVKSINVVAGDEVKAGQILATLDQASVRAKLISAKGSLAQAQANYQRVLAGVSSEQIDVAQKSVTVAQVAYNNAVIELNNTKQAMTDAINQAQRNLADLTSFTSQTNNKRLAVVRAMTGALPQAQSSLDLENKILDDTDLKPTFSAMKLSLVTSLQTAYDQSLPLLNQAKTDLGQAQAYKSDANIKMAVSSSIKALNQTLISLNYCYGALQNSVVSSNFSATALSSYKSAVSTNIAAINSKISGIQTAQQNLSDTLTNYQNAVVNANSTAVSKIAIAKSRVNSSQAAYQQAQANLSAQKAVARPADINVAKAQILSAQGQVKSAQAAFDNTILKSPAAGTITQVDSKVGEQANAMQELMILQNITSLHAEANISEANITSLKIGQDVDYTFDALGPDKHFTGKILTIDPASTIISGVVNYLVKSDLNNIPEIKPGMTINMTILVAQKNNVLAIPMSAIIRQNDKQYVRVIDNLATKNYHKVEVKTGLQADGGLVEITNGLTAGQSVITYLKS